MRRLLLLIAMLILLTLPAPGHQPGCQTARLNQAEEWEEFCYLVTGDWRYCVTQGHAVYCACQAECNPNPVPECEQ